MRVMVTGSRTWSHAESIAGALAIYARPGDILVHGGARGADRIAAEHAPRLGLAVEEHPADWRKWGNAAGPIRNTEMLTSGVDLVLAFQKDRSRGTEHAISEARRLGIRVLRWETDTFGVRVWRADEEIPA